ncbi:MAG: aminodeoxychorismate synthase component I [Thermoanaerobaculia bacterium]
MNGVPQHALLRGPEEAGGWLEFAAPVGGGSAGSPDEVPALLSRAEQATRDGLWAVGWVGYEAAPGFDRALPTRPPSGPVAAFGFFRPPERLELAAEEASVAVTGALRPVLDAAGHARAVAAIRAGIAAGETYQVNLTFPLIGRLEVEPETAFRRLAAAAASPLAAFLDLGGEAILSLSPELFFDLDGERIVMRPMKGTRPRGRYTEEDRALRRELAGSAKDRAENLMIVDMVRNDLGRISRPGSVIATSLNDLERYPTVWQMTSTVEGRTTAPMAEIFGALFPCASITGAPKPRAMEFIARLEPQPRGIYCGAIGWLAPISSKSPMPLSAGEGRRARFSVAIRTAAVDRKSGALRYGVGSGIVWDSDPVAEYDECLVKARGFEAESEPAALLETMRWAPWSGVRRFSRHLARLADSADYFGLPFDEGRVRAAVAEVVATLPPAVHRLRLRLDRSGAPSLEAEPLERAARSWRAVLAAGPVDASSPLLFHKTVRREVYDRTLAEARSRGADEAILWNGRGELTEGTRTNLALRLDGRWLTPSRSSGLLAGVLRGELLDRGRIREAVLGVDDLARAEAVALFSALRGFLRVELLPS